MVISRGDFDKIELKALHYIVVSRNKLIEDLICEFPLSERDFHKAMDMRNTSWEKDKEIWREATEKVLTNKEG